MSYLIQVTFSSPNRPDITMSDIIDPDDWSCSNYWKDIGDTISNLIGFAEHKISQIFRKGHDYQLTEIHSIYLEDCEE